MIDFSAEMFRGTGRLSLVCEKSGRMLALFAIPRNGTQTAI